MKPTDRERVQIWQDTMQEIDHGLWIADIDGVRTNSTSKFDIVVSVCQDKCTDNVGGQYEHYPLADDEVSKENWGGSLDYDLFAQAAESVVRALRDDAVENVLVHCHAGRNRSASICAAALAVYEDSGYHEAFGKVGAARPIVNPNDLMKSHAERFIEEKT